MMTSLFYKWKAEIAQNFVLFAFAIILSLLIYYIGKKIPSLENRRKRKPRNSYLGKRLLISQFLDGYENVRVTSRFQVIYDLERKIVESELKKQFPAPLRNCKKTKELQKKLREELGHLYDKVFCQQSISNQKQLRQAFTFEIKSRIVKHPHDIQNHRRAYGILAMFDDIWDEHNSDSRFSRFKKSISNCWTSIPLLTCFCCSPDVIKAINIFNCCCQGRFNIDCACSLTCTWVFLSCCKSLETASVKYSTGSIVKILLMVVIGTIGIIFYDYYTDFEVLFLYWNISHALKSEEFNFTISSNGTIQSIQAKGISLLGIITSSIPKADNMVGDELGGSIAALLLILIISILLMLHTPPVKMLIRQVRSTLKLQSPSVEEANETIPIVDILHRYDFTIDDKSVEAPVQFFIQGCTYFSISMLLSIANQLETSSGSNAISMEAETLKWEVIRMSGLMSIATLSTAQLKMNNIQNELNINLKQTILYFFASLCNTISNCFIQVTTATAMMDFGCLSQVIQIQNKVLKFVMSILYLNTIFVITICITFLVFRSPPNINIMQSKFRFLRFLHVRKSTILPTSQTTIPSGYFSYHTHLHWSPDLLRLVRSQLFTYISLLISAIFFNISTCALFQYNPILIAVSNITANITNLTPASVSPARFNWIVHTSYVIPLSFFLSYAMLYFYFAMDAGYFSVSNMEFKYTDKDHTERDDGHDGPKDEETDCDDSSNTNNDSNNSSGIMDDDHQANDEDKNCRNMMSSTMYKYCCGDEKSISTEAVHGVWIDLMGTSDSEDGDDSYDGTLEIHLDTFQDSTINSAVQKIKGSFHYFLDTETQ